MNKTLQMLAQCPACGTSSRTGTELFTTTLLQQPCPVVRCPCGLIYKKAMPPQEDLAAIYSDRYVHFQVSTDAAGPAECNSARQKLTRACRLLTGTPPPKGWRLLDVGCAAGQFVSIARQLGFQAEGLDEYLPENRQNDFLHRGRIDRFPAGSFDLVTLLNVVEHLLDPRPLLSGAHRLLRPGGVLLLSCPYGDSWACRRYRDQWVHLTLDEHLLFWTPKALSRILREIGFQGPIDYRISGSPFPYGKVGKIATDSPMAGSPRNDVKGWQPYAWKAARWIQSRQMLANVMRAVVHWTRTGDYLEYVIRKES